MKKNGTLKTGRLDVGARIMHPVQPMLAMACKSVDMAFAKCPNGMFSEIKYDGERVQLHKRGKEFKYFSRSLKPVLPHKVLSKIKACESFPCMKFSSYRSSTLANTYRRPSRTAPT